MKSPRFEVYKCRGESRHGPGVSYGYKYSYRWRLKGKNGEIVASGEAYTRRADCLRAVRCIKRLAAEAVIR